MSTILNTDRKFKNITSSDGRFPYLKSKIYIFSQMKKKSTVYFWCRMM